MKKTQPVTIELNNTERRALSDALSWLHYSSSAPHAPFVHAARAAVAYAVSARTRQVLEDARNGARPRGVVIIENAPYDPSVKHGPRDPEGAEGQKSNSLSEGLVVGFSAQLGDPYAVYQEGRGLVSNVSPSRAHLERLTGLGSRLALGLHIEHAAARTLPGDRAPDGLGLTGVSKEPIASPATVVSDGRLALAAIGEKTATLLRQRRFEAKFPERWRGQAEAARPVRTALVTGEPESPSFVGAFYGDMLEPRGAVARRAREDFLAALEEVAVEVVIEPGVVVLLDNHFVFHGRAPFEPQFDEEGRPYRWLQRVFYTSSMRRFGRWARVSDRIVRACA